MSSLRAPFTFASRKENAPGGFNLQNLARGEFRWSLQKPTKSQKIKDEVVVIRL